MKDIEAPADKYSRFCSSCMHSHTSKETTMDLIHNATVQPSERRKVRLRCSKIIPCAISGRWEAIVQWGGVRPK